MPIDSYQDLCQQKEQLESQQKIYYQKYQHSCLINKQYNDIYYECHINYRSDKMGSIDRWSDKYQELKNKCSFDQHQTQKKMKIYKNALNALNTKIKSVDDNINDIMKDIRDNVTSKIDHYVEKHNKTTKKLKKEIKEINEQIVVLANDQELKKLEKINKTLKEHNKTNNTRSKVILFENNINKNKIN